MELIKSSFILVKGTLVTLMLDQVAVEIDTIASNVVAHQHHFKTIIEQQYRHKTESVVESTMEYECSAVAIKMFLHASLKNPPNKYDVLGIR